ncbi:MAG: NAD(P)/FAD-dependent oxidoreductase [Gemmatimonadetes bacterium]|nr:NAD(P)/FAD-dependent oxidoreductase [Gemmatimonadota bacterium]MYE69581.1 NAD(P)/FAD-dependent oxidoreductase [Gemmatimonadota bacterium]MYJ67776.1 NAD(P)/FAD-dependent oxidoreductase [Gemmatimonadota bacterium]
MATPYDMVVVGAGFAGLACARRASERGLSVLVLDRKSEPGERIHTTGILVKEAWEEWAAPARLVRRINRVRIYTPSHQSVDLAQDDYFFMATDTAGLMRHLVAETGRAGAEIRFGERYQGASANSRTLRLEGSGVRCRFLVGADGAQSAVAASLGLDLNRRLLKGTEWEFEPSDRDGDSLHCFLDPRRAPGYIGWVVPGVRATQVGLAAHRDARADIRGFVASIEAIFGLSGRRVLGRRGGLIPVGGLLRNFYLERVLLVGDAAGMVSPLTAGGIHKAYRFGKLAADAIADYLEANGPHPGAIVRRAYPKLALKHLARWSYDRLPVAKALETGILTRNLVRRVAGKVFFDRLNGTTVNQT